MTEWMHELYSMNFVLKWFIKLSKM